MTKCHTISGFHDLVIGEINGSQRRDSMVSRLGMQCSGTGNPYLALVVYTVGDQRFHDPFFHPVKQCESTPPTIREPHPRVGTNNRVIRPANDQVGQEFRTGSKSRSYERSQR